MLRVGYDEIIERIKKEKGLSDIEIKGKIDKKLSDLAGLISKEGAAHIVANELGIKLFDKAMMEKVKIKDLLIGMRKVGINGKVTSVFSVNSFIKDGKERKVGSFMAGDETGRVRIVVWDEKHIKEMEEGNIKEDVIVKVENAYVKENNNFKELHVGNKGGLELNVDEEIGEVKFSSVIRKNEPKKISELKEGDFASLNGYIVQLFEPRFYDACPDCNRKVVDSRCEQHGEVESQKNAILNFYLDDGSGNVRVVAFRDNVKKLVPDPENGNFEEYKQNIIGNLISIDGKANKNQMFDRIEFVANNIQEFDIDAKIEELMKQVNS